MAWAISWRLLLNTDIIRRKNCMLIRHVTCWITIVRDRQKQQKRETTGWEYYPISECSFFYWDYFNLVAQAPKWMEEKYTSSRHHQYDQGSRSRCGYKPYLFCRTNNPVHCRAITLFSSFYRIGGQKVTSARSSWKKMLPVTPQF